MSELRPSNGDSPKKDRVSLATIVGFSAGSLGTGIYSSVPSVLLLYFMTDTLSIPPALAALAFFFPKIWDVVTDPVMGLISDRTRCPLGRRRPYLLLGAILMSLTFVGLFNVPEFDAPFTSFLYVLTIFTLSATAYTIFAVPYIAMPAEMSADHHERTVIMSFRMGFAMAGILIGSAIAPYLIEWMGGGHAGYAKMSFITGGFCAFSMLIAFFATRHAPSRPAAEGTALSVGKQISVLLRNRAFLMLMFIYVIQLAAMGVFMAVVPYFSVYILGGGVDVAGSIFLVMLSAAILTMAIWTFTAKRLGKRTSFVLSAIVYGLGALSLLLVDSGYPTERLYMQIAIIGFGLAGMQMLPFSMMTDAIHLESLTTGEGREGVYTGFWTACEKLGLAVGPLIAGNLLALSGFKESLGGVAQEQSQFSLLGIKLLIAVFPAILILASALMIRFYPITEKVLSSAIEKDRHSKRDGIPGDAGA